MQYASNRKACGGIDAYHRTITLLSRSFELTTAEHGVTNAEQIENVMEK